jgi:peptidylprolyl isomerase
MQRSIPFIASLIIAGCGSKKPEPPTTPDAAVETAKPTTAPAADTASAPAADTAEAAAPDVAAPPKEGLVAEAPLDVAAPPADAQKTASGLAYKVLKEGAGPTKPTAADTVKVFYVGWTTDGKMFDKQIPPEQPITFPLRGVIAGWTEGVQLMKVGDRFRFWIPKELAYNDRPGRPAGMLVFDVELVDVVKPPETPADVAAPPADAQKTASGLAWKVLQPGKGGPKPTADSTVTVHYSGWTTDGKMFDSSVARGEPASFPLKGVIPGWTEGVQLMEVGSKVRFWIPEELAYKGAGGGAPQGMMVFDVLLLAIR